MSTLTITAPIALINASGLATAIHSSFCARVGSITTRESGRHNADASAAEAALTANMEKVAIVTETRPPNADRTSVVSGKRVSVRIDVGGLRIIKKNTQTTKTKTNINT